MTTNVGEKNSVDDDGRPKKLRTDPKTFRRMAKNISDRPKDFRTGARKKTRTDEQSIADRIHTKKRFHALSTRVNEVHYFSKKLHLLKLL